MREWLFSAVRRIIEAAYGEDNQPSLGRYEREKGTSIAEGPQPEGVFHDAALKFLDQQVVSNRDLDARGAQSFQIGSVVVTVTFGLLSLNKAQTHIPPHAKWALFAALGCYATVALFAFLASLRRNLEYRPDIRTLENHLDAFSGTSLKHWVAREYLASVEENRTILKAKSRLVGARVLFLYLEGAFLALAALVTLL